MVPDQEASSQCDNFTHLLERIYHADTPRLKFYLTSQIIKCSSEIDDETIAIKTIKSVDIDFIALLIQSNGLFTLLGLQLIQLLTRSRHCARILDSLRPLIVSMLSELMYKNNIENENIEEEIKNDLIINGIDCLSLYYRHLPYYRYCDLNVLHESRTEIIQILFPDAYDKSLNNALKFGYNSSINEAKCPYCSGSKKVSSDDTNEFDKLFGNNDEVYDMDYKWQMETFNNIIKESNFADKKIVSIIGSVAKYLLGKVDIKCFHKAIMNCSILLSIGDTDLSKQCIEVLLKHDISLAINGLSIINSKKISKKKDTIQNFKQHFNAILATQLNREDLCEFFSIICDNINLLSSIDEVQLLAKRAYIEIFVIIENIMRSGKIETGKFDIFYVSCNIIENLMIYLDKFENDQSDANNCSSLDIQDKLIDDITSVTAGSYKQVNIGNISQLFKTFHDTIILFFDYFNFLDEKYTKVVATKKVIISCGARLVGCWMYLEPIHLRVQFKGTMNTICNFFHWDDFLWLLPALDYFESHELCDYPSLIVKLLESFYYLSTSKDIKFKDKLSGKDHDISLKKLCILIIRLYLDTLVEPASLLVSVDKIIDENELNKLYQNIMDKIDFEELNKDIGDNKICPNYTPVKLGDIFNENPLEYLPIPYNHIEDQYIDLHRNINKLMTVSTLTNKDSEYIHLIASTYTSVSLARVEHENFLPNEFKDFLYKQICKGLLVSDNDVFESCLNTSIVMSTKCLRFKSILDTTLYYGNVAVHSTSGKKLISYQKLIIP